MPYKKIYVTTVPGAFDHDLPVDIYEHEWIDDDKDEDSNENNEKEVDHEGMAGKRI